MVAPFMPDGEKLAAVREALPAVGAGLYLDTATAGPLPAEVAAAMSEIAEHELRLGRTGRDRDDEVAGRLDEARAAVGAILAVDLEAVTLANGIEDALGRAIRAVDWQPGDGLVWLADPALESLPALAPPGVTTVRAADVAALAAGPEPGPPVRLVAVPLVTATGLRVDLAPIRAAARSMGARLLVEASLAAGAVPLDAATIEADLTVVRSDAWLLGPQGLAVIVAPRDLRERIVPPSGASFHLPSVVGLARACGWLSMYVGLPWALARLRDLTDHAVAAVEAVDGAELLHPVAAGERGPVLAVRIRGWDPVHALDELGRRIFLIASALPASGAVRVSLGWWNTSHEIDRFAEGVALLAAHSPETLPKRERLAILGQDR